MAFSQVEDFTEDFAKLFEDTPFPVLDISGELLSSMPYRKTVSGRLSITRYGYKKVGGSDIIYVIDYGHCLLEEHLFLTPLEEANKWIWEFKIHFAHGKLDCEAAYWNLPPYVQDRINPSHFSFLCNKVF